MRNKILSLQALRTFAFLGIFLSHAGVTKLPLGTWGVSVFLVLSGFLMAVAYYDRKPETGLVPSLLFSWKKILALYPLHILTMLAALWLSKNNIVAQTSNIIANILLVQTWSPKATVYFSLNSVAWYLSVCSFAYFIFPVVFNKLRKATRMRHLVFAAVAVIVLQSLLAYVSYRLRKIDVGNNFFKWISYILPLSRSGDFTVGCILGCVFVGRNKEKTMSPLIATALEFAALVLTLASIFHSSAQLHISWGGYSFWYLLGAVLLVYTFAVNKGILTRILTNKLTVWLGDLSAYGFLLHQIIMRYLSKYVPKFTDLQLSKAMYAVIAFVLTVAASVLYKRYVGPFLAKPVNAAFAWISSKLLSCRKKEKVC